MDAPPPELLFWQADLIHPQLRHRKRILPIVNPEDQECGALSSQTGRVTIPKRGDLNILAHYRIVAHDHCVCRYMKFLAGREPCDKDIAHSANSHTHR